MIATLQHWLALLGLGWFDLKMLFERSVAFESDGLHVLAGVMLQLLAAMLLRSSIARWRPWLIVLALTVANEAVDLWVEQWPAAEFSAQWGESVKDVILTLALPALLLVAARRRPKLFAQP
jgi:hypothetical protein